MKSFILKTHGSIAIDEPAIPLPQPYLTQLLPFIEHAVRLHDKHFVYADLVAKKLHSMDNAEGPYLEFTELTSAELDGFERILNAIVTACSEYITEKLIVKQYVPNGAIIHHRPLCFKADLQHLNIQVTYTELGSFNHFGVAISDLKSLYPNVRVPDPKPAGIIWRSAEEKTREWQYAKEKLIIADQLAPNGTKFERKDILNCLQHSFMVLDDRILAVSGQGIYLGHGSFANAKLAEDEQGQLIALKIIIKYDISAGDKDVAFDCQVAGKKTQRIGSSKLYIAYQYLGITTLDYLASHTVLLDQCYDIGIRCFLNLYELHTGKKTQSKKPVFHRDISLKNIVFDHLGEPHFIDFEQSTYDGSGLKKTDIQKLLEVLFYPIKNGDVIASHRELFSDWFIEKGQFKYQRTHIDTNGVPHLDKQIIYLYLEREDYHDGGFKKIHYMSRDVRGKIFQGHLDLSADELIYVVELEDIQQLKHRFPDPSEYTKAWQNSDLMLAREPENFTEEWKHYPDFFRMTAKKLEALVLAHLTNQGYALNTPIRKPIMSYFYRTLGNTESALEIADMLTLCRFDLDHQLTHSQHSDYQRLKRIHILNTFSKDILVLYDKLKQYTETEPLQDMLATIQAYLFADLFAVSQPSETDLTTQLHTFSSQPWILSRRVKALASRIEAESHAWLLKNGQEDVAFKSDCNP